MTRRFGFVLALIGWWCALMVGIDLILHFAHQDTCLGNDMKYIAGTAILLMLMGGWLMEGRD